MTSKSAASEANPSHLPPRYEIRKLAPEHIPWAAALACHTNIFYSPVWSVAYPNDQVARLHTLFTAGDYLIRHQVNSGFSFGVFDLEYKFKNPRSEATGGALYWDTTDLEATPEKLLEQMDFPLCSIALSYDGHHPLDMKEMLPAIKSLPLFGTVYQALAERDPRPAGSWKATAEKQVLMRNATSTRKDYEGQGLMKKQAQWLMREADKAGYRGIQIECVHDAVTNTWLNPPKPYKSTLVCKLDTETYEEKDEETGEMKKVFSPSKQVVTKIYVTL
ncbi:MAG: hypothetical protein Q9157_007868 [Trypethelium eluteriae]